MALDAYSRQPPERMQSCRVDGFAVEFNKASREV
jgi:hypothetical protein